MKENDVTLIQRTLDGDEAAFTTLVKKYQKWVHTLVWRKIGDFHTAEELTQDIFLKVYKKLSTLKPPEHFPGWLYVITTRHCITWLRKKRVPTTSLDTMPSTELEALCYARYDTAHSEEASIEHQRELVKRLLQKLPESERTVVTLYYLAEMTSEEVGAFLGVSPNTIRSRLRRARKRLQEQEHLLHSTSGVFQLPPTVTENIMREIARIKPASPPVSKPWIPWGLSFASTFLVILMVGMGPRALSRFQQPYNLDATSEMTIELVEDPVLLALERKRDVRNQYGITGNVGSGTETGTKTDERLLAAAQADTTEQLETKPRWIPANGPGGGSASNLFLTSQKDLYAISGAQLYRLTGDNNTDWMLINAELPTPNYHTLIAERNRRLYIATQKHLFVSIDRGATLTPVGPLPEGRAVALLITDPSQVRQPEEAQYEMYLVLTNGVFRSTDAGKTWHVFNEGLTTTEIQAAAVIDNALLFGTNPLFLGTTGGLYRLNTGVWEKLPIAPSQPVESLAVADNRIYFSTRKQNGNWSDSVYLSNDFGESWTDITPQQLPPFVKLAAIGDTLWIIGNRILSSTDAGNTWEDLGPHGHVFHVSSSSPVALDENTLFLGSPGQDIIRSDDGGKSWQPFTAGIAATDIQDIAQVNNVLYAATHKGIATSTDGGARWTYIQSALPSSSTSLTAFGDSLYFRRNRGDSANGLLHLHPHTDTLHPVEGMPVYVDVNHDQEVERLPNATATPAINIKIEEGKIQSAGEFAISGDTFYIEYERKLYRWTRGEHTWHDTGMQDAPAFGNYYPSINGLQFAVSGKVIYLGKSDGSLFQSSDRGDTWRDITATFPFPLDKPKLPLFTLSEVQEMMRKLPHFKDIVYVGNTVYIITNNGGAMSNDGENWQPFTNEKSVPITLSELAVKGTTLYGTSETGTYRLNNETNTWIQIAPKVPRGVTSLVVADDALYVGTRQRGVLRLPLHGLQ